MDMLTGLIADGLASAVATALATGLISRLCRAVAERMQEDDRRLAREN